MIKKKKIKPRNLNVRAHAVGFAGGYVRPIEVNT